MVYIGMASWRGSTKRKQGSISCFIRSIASKIGKDGRSGMLLEIVSSILYTDAMKCSSVESILIKWKIHDSISDLATP